jgi:uncharacterized membrane protein
MMSNSKAQQSVRKPGVFGRLRSWFFTGILVTAPVLLTIYITWAAIQLIDSQVVSLIPILADWNRLEVPGVGLVIGVILITLIGALAAGFLGRWIIRLGESLLNRMPVVRSIYGASKQILETIISSQSDAFREVVLVEYPRKGLWVIGFVTGGTKGEVNRRINIDMVNVFVPTTPNPTSGFLLFCPRKDVVFMKMSVEEAVKLVVSGGIVTPPDRNAAEQSDVASPARKAVVKKAAAKKAVSKKTVAKQAAAKKAPAKKASPRKKAAKKASAKKA